MRCYKCFRHEESCFCKYIKPVDSGVKFVFLMHPKEAKHQRTGTGRLSNLTLVDSEILVGLNFTNNERLLELLADPQYFPVMLYPGEEAWTAKTEDFSEILVGKKLLVLVLDATWFCSRKIIEHSPNLLKLPRLSFFGEYRSIFTFKKEPRPECVSTIESCYYLIKELQSTDIVNPKIDAEPLMDIFRRMVRFQLEMENARVEGKLPSTHAYDWKYTKTREVNL